MEQHQVLDDHFQTRFHDAGRSDVIAFVTSAVTAYHCLEDLTTRMTAMAPSVQSEPVRSLLAQQLDQVTFAKDAVSTWEQDLEAFTTYALPTNAPVDPLAHWQTVSDFVTVHERWLAQLRPFGIFQTKTQLLSTQAAHYLFPAEALFQVVQGETGESEAIDLDTLAQADPSGIYAIADSHHIEPLATFSHQD